MDWLALHAVHAGSADEEWNSRCFKWSFMSVAYASNQPGTLRPGRLPRTCHLRQFPSGHGVDWDLAKQLMMDEDILEIHERVEKKTKYERAALRSEITGNAE